MVRQVKPKALSSVWVGVVELGGVFDALANGAASLVVDGGENAQSQFKGGFWLSGHIVLAEKGLREQLKAKPEPSAVTQTVAGYQRQISECGSRPVRWECGACLPSRARSKHGHLRDHVGGFDAGY